MREYKKVLLHVIWISLVLCIWFMYIYGNSPAVIKNSQDLLSYLGINAGYNYVMLHCSVYLGLYIILLFQIIPQINEQHYIRMPRTELLKKEICSALFCSLIFTAVFTGVHFLMLVRKVGVSIIFQYDFGIAWGLNYIRMSEIYFIFGLLYILFEIILSSQRLAVLGAIAAAVLWVFSGKYLGITKLYSDFAVYDSFYSKTGLDVIGYMSEFFRHCMIILCLIYVSITMFERKDIVNDKR